MKPGVVWSKEERKTFKTCSLYLPSPPLQKKELVIHITSIHRSLALRAMDGKKIKCSMNESTYATKMATERQVRAAAANKRLSLLQELCFALFILLLALAQKKSGPLGALSHIASLALLVLEREAKKSRLSYTDRKRLSPPPDSISNLKQAD